MTNLVTYEKLLEIKLFSGKSMFIPLSKTPAFVEQLETKKFISIGNTEGFAASAVESWAELDESSMTEKTNAENEKKLIETMASSLSVEQKIKVRETISIWKSEHKHKFLTAGVIENIINSIL